MEEEEEGNKRPTEGELVINAGTTLRDNLALIQTTDRPVG